MNLGRHQKSPKITKNNGRVSQLSSGVHAGPYAGRGSFDVWKNPLLYSLYFLAPHIMQDIYTSPSYLVIVSFIIVMQNKEWTEIK